LDEELREKILNYLLSEADSENSSEFGGAAAQADNESSEPIEKRAMSYRYGKRMSYRYGKRSAMPYRFGKRAAAYSPELLEFLRLNENNFNTDQFRSDKRMSYRYGRSVDHTQNSENNKSN
jgi:hypothetical protein